jgi:septal ring factor EnvC (AmiA/AmiB activator)
LEVDSCLAREFQLQDKHDQQVTQMANMEAKCQAGQQQLQAANAALLDMQAELAKAELEKARQKRMLTEVCMLQHFSANSVWHTASRNQEVCLLKSPRHMMWGFFEFCAFAVKLLAWV